MNIVEALNARAAGPDRAELEQAILRVTTLSLVTLYVCWYVSRDGYVGEHARFDLAVLAGWLILAIGIFAGIWMRPSVSVARRMVGIFADVGANTFGLFVMDGGGVILVGVYLFIIFGNGFRYGRLYLYVSQLLSLIGFVLAVSMVPWWRHELLLAIAATGWMIVLPPYVGTLAERLNGARLRAEEARRKAEAALKACVERQRSAS